MIHHFVLNNFLLKRTIFCAITINKNGSVSEADQDRGLFERCNASARLGRSVIADKGGGMRATVISAFFVFIVSSAPSAQAGIWLQLLHNNSSSSVSINAKLPSDWTGTPKYPISIPKHRSVFDEDFYDDASYKLCRKKINNVAVPQDCSANPSVYLSISVPGEKKYYRIYDCDWKINVITKKGNQWKPYKSIPIYVGQGNKYFFALIVGGKGGLDIKQRVKVKDLADGDKFPGNRYVSNSR